MKRSTAIAALAAVLSLAGPAQAAPTLVGTTCGFAGKHESGWIHGTLYATAATVDPVGPTTSETFIGCGLLKNGIGYWAGDLSLPSDASVLLDPMAELFADSDDVVTVCTQVWVDGTKEFDDCRPVIWDPVLPDPACDLNLCPLGQPFGVYLHPEPL